jgi:hypothetical protein
MLNEAEINVGRALTWLGMTVSAAMLAYNLMVEYVPGLGPLAACIMLLTCTHIVQRSIVSHDKALREAFNHGREHGKLQAVVNLHDRERI